MDLAAIACPIATETAATSGVDIGVIVNTFPDTMECRALWVAMGVLEGVNLGSSAYSRRPVLGRPSYVGLCIGAGDRLCCAARSTISPEPLDNPPSENPTNTGFKS